MFMYDDKMNYPQYFLIYVRDTACIKFQVIWKEAIKKETILWV